MGLGAYPASDPQWLGMLGMHGTYEANLSMRYDVMICIGARFDDHHPGRLGSVLARLEEDHRRRRSVLDQQERQGRSADHRRLRARARGHGAAVALERDAGGQAGARGLVEADRQMARAQIALLRNSNQLIKPQYAIGRLYELTKNRDTYITTEVGQHQMWAAQFYRFEQPNRWMTSGGLGTMGYGLPASVGVQLAHPNSAESSISPAKPRC